MVEYLGSNFPNHYIGKASPSEMFEIYSKAKVAINFAPLNDLNMRVFEVLGTNSVLLTNKLHSNGIELLFQNGVHYLEYNNEKDAKVLMEKILSNQELRKKIVESANREILEKHTYDNRVLSILTIVEDLSHVVKPCPMSYSVAAETIDDIPSTIFFFDRSLRIRSRSRKRNLIVLFTLPFIRIATNGARIIMFLMGLVQRESRN